MNIMCAERWIINFREELYGKENHVRHVLVHDVWTFHLTRLLEACGAFSAASERFDLLESHG